MVLTHRDPHSVKLWLWSWLASGAKSGVGAKPPQLRSVIDTSIADVLWEFVTAPSELSEKFQSNFITVLVEEANVLSVKQKQIFTSKIVIA